MNCNLILNIAEEFTNTEITAKMTLEIFGFYMDTRPLLCYTFIVDYYNICR